MCSFPFEPWPLEPGAPFVQEEQDEVLRRQRSCPELFSRARHWTPSGFCCQMESNSVLHLQRGATCLLWEKTEAVGVSSCVDTYKSLGCFHQPWPREAQRMSVLGVDCGASLCWLWPFSSYLGLNESLPLLSLLVLMSVYTWHASASSESTSITDAHYRPAGFLPLSQQTLCSTLEHLG